MAAVLPDFKQTGPKWKKEEEQLNVASVLIRCAANPVESNKNWAFRR
jgi:hypothetical protein